MVLSLQMQSVVESEQVKVDMQKKNLDERQLNKSKCMATPPFQKLKIYIYIYIYSSYIYIPKKNKKRRKIDLVASPTGRTLSHTGRTQQKTTSSKVLPVGL